MAKAANPVAVVPGPSLTLAQQPFAPTPAIARRQCPAWAVCPATAFACRTARSQCPALPARRVTAFACLTAASRCPAFARPSCGPNVATCPPASALAGNQGLVGLPRRKRYVSSQERDAQCLAVGDVTARSERPRCALNPQPWAGDRLLLAGFGDVLRRRSCRVDDQSPLPSWHGRNLEVQASQVHVQENMDVGLRTASGQGERQGAGVGIVPAGTQSRKPCQLTSGRPRSFTLPSKKRER